MSSINSFAPLDRTVTDSAQAQSVYTVLYGLPIDLHPPLCGNDNGLMYQLTFSRQGSVIGDYVPHAAGCPYVSLSPSDRRGLTDDFWTLLPRTLGVSVEELLTPSD